MWHFSHSPLSPRTPCCRPTAIHRRTHRRIKRTVKGRGEDRRSVKLDEIEAYFQSGFTVFVHILIGLFLWNPAPVQTYLQTHTLIEGWRWWRHFLSRPRAAYRTPWELWFSQKRSPVYLFLLKQERNSESNTTHKAQNSKLPFQRYGTDETANYLHFWSCNWYKKNNWSVYCNWDSIL